MPNRLDAMDRRYRFLLRHGLQGQRYEDPIYMGILEGTIPDWHEDEQGETSMPTLLTDVADLTEEFTEHPASNCSCEYHKMKRMEAHNIKRSPVHEYSHRPARGWQPKKVKNDVFGYYLGVELETDSYSSKPNPAYNNRMSLSTPLWRRPDRNVNKFSDIDNEQAADLRRPKNLWTPKHDSSVSGPEFVSHPATLTYWHKQEKALKEMFQTLLHAGYRSHDNDRCGMHVNISRSAFINADHLYGFLTLLHYSPTWSLRMSQRTAESAGHWSPLGGGMAEASVRHAIANRAFSGTSYAITDKYSALNIPHLAQGRVEFRLPRGTLRLDRFFKNLEWTTAMVEFTKTAKVVDLKPKPFMAYAYENRSEYPNLVKFITERKDKLMVGAGRPPKGEGILRFA